MSAERERGFYWVRFTRGILKGEYDVAELRASWWFIGREVSRTDQDLRERGIEVVALIEPPKETG